MTTLHIPGPPPTITQQMKGVRCVPDRGSMRPMFYKKKAYREAENFYLSHIPPGKPYKGPVGLRVEFQWEWRKSEPKKNRVDGWRYKDSKPDNDNLVKLLADLLEKRQFGFSHDAQIAELTCVKTWGDEAFTRISVWSLDEEQELWVDRNNQPPQPEGNNG